MRHLVLCDYGTFVGISGALLRIKQGDETKHYPLNRLSTISIAKRGISFSSDLIEALSARNIKLFFLDFRGVAHSALVGESQHGVVAIRLTQQKFFQSGNLQLPISIISGKIKNQRSVLNYLNKYHSHQSLQTASQRLASNLKNVKKVRDIETLLGIEGSCASEYFQALRESKLLSPTFTKREGRGSQEINNSMLNLGYAVLSSYVLSAVINAGLEPYLGVLHSKRPGKMALVLDLMEEYRSWVVDRAVIKFRQQINIKKNLDSHLKKLLILEIQKTLSKRYLYRKKRVKLEHIIQRQIYRLCGYLYGDRQYKPYLFKW